MKIAALIATLLIGSSSLALAHPNEAPVTVTNADNCEPPIAQPIAYRPIHRPTWRTLSQPERLVNGQLIDVGRAKGPLNTFELKAVTGSSYVKSVLIQFSTGGSQTVGLNQRLDRNNPTISIDIAGRDRTIKHVYVYGSGRAGSSYQLLAV